MEYAPFPGGAIPGDAEFLLYWNFRNSAIFKFALVRFSRSKSGKHDLRF